MARANSQQRNDRNTGTALVVLEQQLVSAEPDFRRLAQAARRGMDFSREYQFALSLFTESEQLQKCHPESFKEAFTNLGAMGLSLNRNLGHAALIPRWNTKRNCNWAVAMPMYRGLISLATGGSVIKNVYGAAVLDGDGIELELGSIPKLKHTPKMRKKGEGGLPSAENMLGAYCIADIAGSELPHVTWVAIDDVLEIAKRSDSYNPKPRPIWENGKKTDRFYPAKAPSGPWITDFGQMAVKSGFRRGFKTWPGVDKIEYTALQEAVRVDMEAEILEQTPDEQDEGQQDTSVIEATACLSVKECEELDAMCREKKIKPERMAEAYGQKSLKQVPAELYLEIKARIQRAGGQRG